MKTSEIIITVETDTQNIPKKISWAASQKPEDMPEITRAFMLSLLSEDGRSAMRIDLWTPELQVHEMKLFFIQTIGGMADTVFNATGDEYFLEQANQLCERLSEKLAKELETVAK